MAERGRVLPHWFPYLDLGCVVLAGALWYALPQVGPWPLLLGLAPWLARYALLGRLTRRTAFDLPLLIFLLTAALVVWSAYDRQAAWPKFWLIVGGVLLFYALVNAEPLGGVRGWLLAVFGAVVALYFLASHDWDAYPAKIEALTRLGRALQAPLPTVPGHRLHPNVAGGIMALMLPYAGWALFDAWRGVRGGQKRWWTLLLALGLLGLTSFGLLMTTSRGAWLSLAVALLLAGLWFIASALSRGSAERRSWILPALLALVLAVALGVGLAWPGGLFALLEALPGGNTGLDRLNLFRRTLTLVGDYPLIGAGLGGFRMLYSTYVLLLHVGYTVHSHNLYLNVAVEQGLPALLALAWTGVLFAWAVWRGLVRGEGGAGRGLLGAAALSLLVAVGHSFVDDVLYGSRALVLMFVPLAFAVPFLSRARLGRRSRLSLPLVLLLCLLAALIWRGPLLSRVYGNLGAVRQSRAELSRYSWPEWPIQDALRREIDLDPAMAALERALALDPGNATANRRLGLIELSRGEYEDALEHLAAAYLAQPGNETSRQLYGEALIANGFVAEGQAQWATVSNEQGQLQNRVYWYQSIGDTERAAWMKQAAEAVSDR